MVNDRQAIGTSSSIREGIDVIIRYHKPDRLLELDIALTSLFNQSYEPVRAILVTQNFNAADLRAVEDVARAYDWGERHAVPIVVNVECPPGVDARSKLLNVGVRTSNARYIAFLDYDDLLYSHAYEHLVSMLRDHNVAIAFGGVVVKHVCVFANFVYNLNRIDDAFRGHNMTDFVRYNFCPIHSFAIDRNVVHISDLYFNEELARLEDYDFLLRLALKYKFSFEGINRKVGVYNYHIDGSNSAQVFRGVGSEYEANKGQWNSARRHIWRLKNKVRDHLKI